ncbi:hypothetical protein EDB83DRAFT_784933 [Lactarius deliciosus]|nr:hypothetical protein EDB83DRAFT_784933 [Lactarius deliciosus]
MWYRINSFSPTFCSWFEAFEALSRLSEDAQLRMRTGSSLSTQADQLQAHNNTKGMTQVLFPLCVGCVTTKMVKASERDTTRRMCPSNLKNITRHEGWTRLRRKVIGPTSRITGLLRFTRYGQQDVVISQPQRQRRASGASQASPPYPPCPPRTFLFGIHDSDAARPAVPEIGSAGPRISTSPPPMTRCRLTFPFSRATSRCRARCTNHR